MIKHSIKYSGLCGLFLLMIFFVPYYFGSNALLDPIHFFFDLGIYSLFIFFASHEYKKYNNHGYLHFWEGISIGMIVIIPAVFIFSFFFYLTFNTNSFFLEEYKEGAKQLLTANKDIYLNTFSENQLTEQYTAIDTITISSLCISTLKKKNTCWFFGDTNYINIFT